MKGPDDITMMDGVVYVVYQNNTAKDGSSGNATSTLVAYQRDGTQLGTWSLIGHADGLAADRSRDRLIVTVNEDANSSLYTVSPGAQPPDQIRHYTYSPDPATLNGGGGTDAVSVLHGRILISASNPGTQGVGAAVYTAAVPEDGSVATLNPTFNDNSQATDAVTGNPVTLNLSDPDSNAVVPSSSPRFAGDFLLDSQADSQLIFARHAGRGDQSLTSLSLTSSSGAPQVDDVTWTTDPGGTLLMVDASANQIDAITGPFDSGTTLTAIPNDSQALPGDLGTIDLQTGSVTPFATGFGSPKGLLYIPPSASESRHHGHGRHGPR